MTFSRNKIWFITGATGCVGRALVEKLDGHVGMRLLVRADNAAAARRRLAGVLGPKGLAALADGVIQPIVGDLSAPGLGLPPDVRADVTDDLAGVLHVAARTDFDDGHDVEAYRDDNVNGALRALEIAEDASCPYVHVSTAYVSGVRSGLIGEGELDAGQSHRNGYERSKFEAEKILRATADAKGVPMTVFRPSIILPEEPRSGTSEGPGPLAYLRLLANLEGRRSRRVRTIRYAGDDDGLLNLVPQKFVVDVLAHAVMNGARPGETYHVTASKSFQMRRVAGLMNEHLAGLETVLVPDLDTSSLDRYEKILERSFRMYADYLFLDHEYDRTALDRDFGLVDGADEDWLSDTYAKHLSVWRSERRQRRADDTESRAIREYFTRFLPERTGQRLVPGLASLSAELTVTVSALGSYALRIESGVLTDVSEVSQPSNEIDYEVDAAALLEVVAGRSRPADLFFAKQIVIRGDLYRALSTATALEEFFRLFPFTPHRTPELVG
jgi:nucleoside-diphosphate-sugar epimerase